MSAPDDTAPRPSKLAAALAWAERGFRVFPLQENGKLPAFSDSWLDLATRDPATITGWYRDTLTPIERCYNFGCATGQGLIVIDLDVDEEKGINGPREWAKLGGKIGDTLVVKTPRGGFHLYYLTPRRIALSVGKRGGLAVGVDVRCHNGYVVAPGSSIDGVAYTIEHDGPPARLPAHIDERLAEAPPDRPVVDEQAPAAGLDHEASVEAVRRLLASAPGAIGDGTGGNNDTYKLGVRCLELGVSAQRCLELMLEDWNERCEPPWPPGELREVIENGMRYRQNQAASRSPAALFGDAQIFPPTRPVVHEPDDSAAAEGLEAALVDQFAARHAGELRYVEAEGAWRAWDGQRWQSGASWIALQRAFAIAREAARAEDNPSRRNAVGSERTRGAVERLARHDPRMRAEVDHFDAHDWLLNTPDGVVNLRTGEMRPPDPALLMSKCTSVAPAEGGAPLWDRFLDDATCGDRGLKRYLQKIAGMALTGDVSQQEVYFLLGEGGAGKGTFLHAVEHILGKDDYARNTPAKTWLLGKHDNSHPTDLASLAGSRLATAQEVRKDQVWNAALMKQMSGGDLVTARFLFRNFFTFLPRCTLIFASNYPPRFTEMDSGLRRRIRIVPFDRPAGSGEDRDLPKKLEPEHGAVLRWMIEGCIAWQREGMEPPAAVKQRTDEYFAAEDLFAQWLEDCCVLDLGAVAPFNDLFQSWTQWRDRRREDKETATAFGITLRQRGFRKRKHPGTGARGRAGLRLRASSDTAATFEDTNVLPFRQ